MTDYKTMYAILCGSISDALELLSLAPKENAKAIMLLEQALIRAEELYLNGGEG